MIVCSSVIRSEVTGTILKLSLSLILFLYAISSSCQIRYYDADNFPLYGKGVEATSERYVRFPDSLKNVSRKPLWDLSRHSSGMYIRFRTNSPEIYMKWNPKYNNHMNHMSDTGVKGLDLYCYDCGEWNFVNSARPSGEHCESKVISGMTAKWREYMLYLPLYDSVDSLYIGIGSEYSISLPELDMPRSGKPVVFYGTSIQQGACASRPGMAHTNIISRRLNVETVNFGFSGNAFLDMEVADLMAAIDASVYVMDCLPNSSPEMIEERLYPFYKKLRQLHPDVPVVFIEDPMFVHSRYDNKILNEINRKNEALHEVFDEMKRNGEKNIIIVSLKDFMNQNSDMTVDGIHFTDLGFVLYSDLIIDIIKDYVDRERTGF